MNYQWHTLVSDNVTPRLEIMTIIPTTVHIFPVSIQYVVSNVFAVIRSLQRNLCGCRGQWKIQTAVENSQARRGRCRFRDTSTWKCHVRKRLRNSGKSYNSRDGKVRREKLLKPGCGAKCRLRCHDRIPVEQREEIFQSYWKIGNLHAQRQFLVTHVTRNPRCRASKSSHHRKRSFKYAFHVDGLVFPVCKTFFLHTLSISQQMIETELDKITAGGHLLPGKRKQPKSWRIPENIRQSVTDHINKFQPVPSHYCRHSSTKTYLPETLSLSEMYTQKIKCWNGSTRRVLFRIQYFTCWFMH